MKCRRGFSRSLLSSITIALMIASFWLLALLPIPIGIAGASWTGVGAVGMVIVGMLLFDETREWNRPVFVRMIVSGIAGFKFSTGTTA